MNIRSPLRLSLGASQRITPVADVVAALLLSVLLTSPAASGQASSVPKPPPGCTSAESRQLDFWVGHWNVTPQGAPGKKVATSLIEKLYAGCAIRENWMPNGGGDGGSLSSYLPDSASWQQVWVDSSGSWVTFTGKWDGHAMVLEGEWPAPAHPHQRTRMSYHALPDGSVEQKGETSDDGKSWAPSFDFIYTRAPNASSPTAGGR